MEEVDVSETAATLLRELAIGLGCIMKRGAALLGAAALLALSSPANAGRFTAWYFGVDGGANWVEGVDAGGAVGGVAAVGVVDGAGVVRVVGDVVDGTALRGVRATPGRCFSVVADAAGGAVRGASACASTTGHCCPDDGSIRYSCRKSVTPDARRASRRAPVAVVAVVAAAADDSRVGAAATVPCRVAAPTPGTFVVRTVTTTAAPKAWWASARIQNGETRCEIRVVGETLGGASDRLAIGVSERSVMAFHTLAPTHTRSQAARPTTAQRKSRTAWSPVCVPVLASMRSAVIGAATLDATSRASINRATTLDPAAVSSVGVVEGEVIIMAVSLPGHQRRNSRGPERWTKQKGRLWRRTDGRHRARRPARSYR